MPQAKTFGSVYRHICVWKPPKLQPCRTDAVAIDALVLGEPLRAVHEVLDLRLADLLEVRLLE